MKTIAIISQKGGSGKSTLAISLACEAEAQDRQTLLVDVDQQATTYKWFKLRNDNIPHTVPTQPVALEETLDQYRELGAELAIIDTAGVSSSASTAVAKLADVVLIPSRVSAFDINAIGDSIDIAKLAGKTPFVVFNAVHPNAHQTFEEIKKVVEDTYNVAVLPYFLSQRSTFSHCMISGNSPQEYEPDGKAHQEIKAIYSWLDNMLA